MNQSRQYDSNSEARYGYGSYGNNNQPNSNNNFPAVIPNIVGGNYNQNYNHSGNVGYYGSQLEKAYSVVQTEPIMLDKNRPIILVDPIMEPHVKSYLTWSIFNIIFCCFFGGIATTLLSCNVMRLNDSKKYKEALRLSGKVLVANMAVTALGALIFLIVFPYVYMAIYPSLPKINW